MSEDEEYYNDYDFGDSSDEDENVVSYGQVGQVSSIHHLLAVSGVSDLSKFAEKINASIKNIIPDSDERVNQLNQILNFIEKKSKELEPIYYKNSDMFIIGYLCIKNSRIDQNRIKSYSRDYNINDIIRYATYIQKIL